MRRIDRRRFLANSAALAASFANCGPDTSFAAAADTDAKTTKQGEANGALQVAVVGVHGHGMEHVRVLAGNRTLNTRVKTICDADEGVIDRAMSHVEKVQDKLPKFQKDIRKVLDDRSIDIVTIATPNHWHALAAIWAMQSGKDVYVEKPVSHNVHEGRKMVEAARAFGRVCQTGTQRRSMAGIREAIGFLHQGKLGRIHLARGLCYRPRPSIGTTHSEQQIPNTVDYDLWCGPAPKKPLHRQRLHYDWHWFWDYGNGEIGNNGIHMMDIARWGLRKNELARSVISVGGRFGYADDGETPNTQLCLFDYGDSKILFEVRGLPTEKMLDIDIGVIFYGSEGYLAVPPQKGPVAYGPSGEVLRRFAGDSDGIPANFANFVSVVRSRHTDDLNADILEGHLSSALCHLGNISHRLGRKEPFSKRAKAFGDDKDAVEAFARMEDHLKGDGVPLDQTSYSLGRKLATRPGMESFVSDSEADALLKRQYRAPFVVPERL
jgi:predicted dehydrogenase